VGHREVVAPFSIGRIKGGKRAIAFAGYQLGIPRSFLGYGRGAVAQIPGGIGGIGEQPQVAGVILHRLIVKRLSLFTRLHSLVLLADSLVGNRQNSQASGVSGGQKLIFRLVGHPCANIFLQFSANRDGFLRLIEALCG